MVSQGLEYHYTINGTVLNLFDLNPEVSVSVLSFSKEIVQGRCKIQDMLRELMKFDLNIDSQYGKLDVDFGMDAPFMSLYVDTHEYFGSFNL